MVLALSLIAGLLPALVSAAAPAVAAVTDLRVATWNMRGSVSGVNKWGSIIPGMMRAHGLRVMALQEHSDNWDKSLENTGAKVTDVEGNGAADDGTGDLTTSADPDDQYADSPRGCMDDFTSDKYKTSEFGKTRYAHLKIEFPAPHSDTFHVYLLKTKSSERTLAMISDQPASACRIQPALVEPRKLDEDAKKYPELKTRGDWRLMFAAKPLFGLKFGDTWVYNLHAESKGDKENDVDKLVAPVSTRLGERYAVVGDYNREMETLVLGDLDENGNRLDPDLPLDPGEAAVGSTKNTFKVGREQRSKYDYMIANGFPATTPHMPSPERDRQEYTGFRQSYITSTDSDHYPVVFRKETDKALRKAGEDKCLPVPASNLRVAGDDYSCSLRSPAIVSMGDSYISGEAGRWAGNANTPEKDSVWGTDRGMSAYVDNTGYQSGNKCDRSDVAEIKGADVAGVPPERRFNLACSGALTQHVLAETFKGEKPQIQQLEKVAADNEVKLITVSVGGNDLGFSDIVTTCATNYLNPATSARCNKTQQEKLDKGLRETQPKIHATLQKIIDTMADLGYQRDSYRLVLQSYPAPMPVGSRFREKEENYQRYTRDGCPFYNDDATWAHDKVIPAIGGMLRGAASSVGADFLDLRDAFDGHELCADRASQAAAGNSAANPLPAEKAEWVRWVPGIDKPWLPQPNFQGAAQEAIHPNAFGQRALSACLTQFARTQKGSSLKCVGTPGKGPDSVRLGSITDPGPTPGRPIDAALTLDHDDVYVFHGPAYAKVEGSTHIDGGVKGIYETWPALRGTRFANKIDGGFVIPGENRQAYLFSGDQYLVLGLGGDRGSDWLREGPAPIAERWPSLRGTGFDTGVDAAFADGQSLDTAYLIKGDKVVDVRFGGFPLQTVAGTVRGTGEMWHTLKQADPAGTTFRKKVDAAFGIGIPGGCRRPVPTQWACSSGWSEFVLISDGKLARFGKHGYQAQPGSETLESGPSSVCETWQVLCGTIFAPNTPAKGEDGKTPGQLADAPVKDGQSGKLKSATGLLAAPGSNAGAPVTGAGATTFAGDDKSWAFHDAGNGNWLIETQATNSGNPDGKDLLLDTSASHGANLVDYVPGGAYQGWMFRPAGSGWYNLMDNTDGTCLTAGNAGAGLVAAECDGRAAQRWQPAELSAVLPPTKQPTEALVSSDGFAVDLDFGDRTPGTKIQARNPKPWWPQPQQWLLREQGTGSWVIETGYGGSKVLGRGPDDQTQLVAYSEGAAGQRWSLADAGGGWLKLANGTGGCLTSAAVGEALRISACTGSAQQKWRRVPDATQVR
ncbi:hypothetical protein ACFWMR_28455 [Amycolatopsis thailandensis]|uniref:hypothetical protein n=1 Tax=Amycolatopsis thailandensis TaxID=589330 RepID=UPI003650146D